MEEETRIKLLNTFQDSYLEDRGQQTLRQQVREAELMVEMERATRQFLLEKFGGRPEKTASAGKVAETAREYLERVTAYVEGIAGMQELERSE